MTVTQTEPCGKNRCRIYLDGEPAFILYRGEMKRLDIREGAHISGETVETIHSEILYRRARMRAMHLLEDMDRTEAGLREKLRQGEYPVDVIEKAITYVRSFGYLNDARYAENFILSRSTSKSRRELRALLTNKGVSAEDIDRAFAVCYPDDAEQEAVRKILKKKHIDPDTAGKEELHKIYGYLARKGFRYETIRQVIQNDAENA